MRELLKLLNSPLRNINTVVRYSGFRLLQPETVDAHTMDMAVTALNIINHFDGKYIDKHKLIYDIIVHDLEEATSCDIPRTVKYHNDDVHAAIESTTQALVRKHVSDDLFNDMTNAKNINTLEGRIVKFLDMFQCNMILEREIRGYGNRTLRPVLHSAKNLLFQSVYEEGLFANDIDEVREYFENITNEWKIFTKDMDLDHE